MPQTQQVTAASSDMSRNILNFALSMTQDKRRGRGEKVIPLKFRRKTLKSSLVPEMKFDLEMPIFKVKNVSRNFKSIFHVFKTSNSS